MATATVLYVLNMGGNLKDQVGKLTAQTKQLYDAAEKARAGFVSMSTSARGALNNAAEQGKQAAEGAFKAAAGFAAAGFAVHTLLKDQEDYEQSTARLVKVTKDLGKSISEAIGPTVADFIDRFTVGLSYIGTLMTGVVGPAVGTLANLFAKFSERVSESLRAWKLIAVGDFAGAASILAGHADAVQEIVDIAKAGFAEIGEVQKSAFDAAFATWKQQVDGISDLVGKAKQSYAEVAGTAEAGKRAGAGSIVIGGMPVPMGQQTGPGAGMEYQSPLATEALEVNYTQAEELAGIGNATASMEKGIGGVLGMIPVFGGFLEGIWSFLKDFGGISMSIVDELIGFVTGLAEQFGTIITEVPMKLIAAMPDMLTSIIALIPRLILELVASGPQLFAALIEAIIALPVTIGREFVAMFEQFWLEIKEAFNSIAESLGLGKNSPRERRRNDDARAVAAGIGNTSATPAQIAQLQEMAENSRRAPRALGGGVVRQSGLVQVHRNERIVPANRAMGGSQVVNVQLHAHGITNPDELIRELQRRLGTYGIGLTLEPVGSR